jgi:hypothetical protein
MKSPIDPEIARQQLLARYSGMEDEPLERLAGEWESLTDPARLALKQELDRRGLHIEHARGIKRDLSGDSEVERAAELPLGSGEFVAIRELKSPAEVAVVQGFLEAVGIKTLLVDGHNLPYESMDIGNLWPIRLHVERENAGNAIELLTATFPEGPDSEE